MNRIKQFFIKHAHGIYKGAICVCICILCFLTVIITDSGNGEVVKTESNGSSSSIVEVPDEKIKEIVASIQPEPESQTDVEDVSIVTEDEYVVTPEFIAPLYGEISKAYSDNLPVYSTTMDDWRLHRGVDIVAPIGSDVTASEQGRVTFVGHDISLGYVVKVEFGEYECIYASLDSKIPVTKDDYVNKGQIIGTVSDSCISEICDEPHLHFEMKKNGKYVNPEELIPFV